MTRPAPPASPRESSMGRRQRRRMVLYAGAAAALAPLIATLIAHYSSVGFPALKATATANWVVAPGAALLFAFVGRELERHDRPLLERLVEGAAYGCIAGWLNAPLTVVAIAARAPRELLRAPWELPVGMVVAFVAFGWLGALCGAPIGILIAMLARPDQRGVTVPATLDKQARGGPP